MKILSNLLSRVGLVSQADLKKLHREIAQAAYRRGYAAAANNRLFGDWSLSTQTQDAHLRSDLKIMRERARELCRDDDYAKKFQWELRSNVIGDKGITLQMQVKNPDGSLDKRANELIEEEWAEASKPENFTVMGTLSRPEVEGLSVQTKARDGETILRMVDGYPDNKYRFAVQPFEADQLDHELNVPRLANGNSIRMGVELNAWRKPVAYYLLKDQPGDIFYSQSFQDRWERVPAEDIIHDFIGSMFLQTRGETWYAQACTRLKMLNGYEHAELVKARASACKGGFLEQDAEHAEYTGDGQDEQGNIVNELAPGEIELLPPGIRFKEYDPSSPNTEFSNFRKAILRGVAAGLVTSYNSLACDLEGVNYSSLRTAALSERDIWKLLQGLFIMKVEQRIFSRWLKMALLAKAIKLPAEKFDKFNRPKFVGRRWAWVDPEKDIKAAVMAINNRLTSRTAIVKEEGEDFEKIIDEVADEESYAESAGVDLPPVDPKAETSEQEPPAKDE